jgi:hypothetical protein
LKLVANAVDVQLRRLRVSTREMQLPPTFLVRPSKRLLLQLNLPLLVLILQVKMQVPRLLLRELPK